MTSRQEGWSGNWNSSNQVVKCTKQNLCKVFDRIFSFVIFTDTSILLTATVSTVCFAHVGRQAQSCHIRHCSRRLSRQFSFDCRSTGDVVVLCARVVSEACSSLRTTTHFIHHSTLSSCRPIHVLHRTTWFLGINIMAEQSSILVQKLRCTVIRK